MPHDPQSPVLLFDGVCNLCNGAVNWILDRDRRGRVRFAALQSEAARRLLAERGIEVEIADPPDSLMLLDADGLHVRSDAALRVAGHLGGVWSWLSCLRLVPRPLRDGVYRWIARNRYRWFGKRETCRMPTPELAGRFLDAGESGGSPSRPGATP